MTLIHLSDDDRFAVSLAVESLGIRNEVSVSADLCDRIETNVSAYRAEVDDRLHLSDWLAQLRSLAQLLSSDAPSVGLIRTRVARLPAPHARQIEARALRLSSNVPAFSGIDLDLRDWARRASPADLVQVLCLCLVEGGAMIAGRRRPNGHRSAAHFEPVVFGRGVNMPKRKGGRPADDAEVRLIAHLAVDWMISTGVRPGRGRDGHSAFSGLVHDVFGWIGIENKAQHCLRMYWKLTKVKRPMRW